VNLKNVVTFILDVEAHEYQHTNRREPSHPDYASASHLLSISDAKKVMKKLLTDSLCLLTKPQPYQRPDLPLATGTEQSIMWLIKFWFTGQK